MATVKPKVDPQVLAEEYGWASTFLNHNTELKNIFAQAVAHNWSPAKFTAEVRTTDWFRQNSDTYRANQVLKSTDVTTYNQRLATLSATIADTAAAGGAQLSDHQLKMIAQNAFNFSWSDAQIKDALGQYVKTVGGFYSGAASDTAQQLHALALQNGVQVSDSFVDSYVKGVETGSTTLQAGQDHIRTMASSAFPAWAEQIKAGQNVADLASPYMQQMGKTLELDSNAIDLFDPTIRKALQASDPSGKVGTPSVMPLWQFEQSLKQDPRWMKTQNAQDSLMANVHGVLQSWGVQS